MSWLAMESRVASAALAYQVKAKKNGDVRAHARGDEKNSNQQAIKQRILQTDETAQDHCLIWFQMKRRRKSATVTTNFRYFGVS
jgi:hypothetical protein